MTRGFAASLVTTILALALPAPPAVAQVDGDWQLDPAVLATGDDLLQRVPAREIDALLQAVHSAARNDAEAPAICAAFDPHGDRSLDGLGALAAQLGPASRERLTTTVANMLLAALQSPPQAYEPAAAQQALKAAAVTAAILHDGFASGMSASGDSIDARAQRCRSLRWLLDAMQSRPLDERVAMTRLLLAQGLRQLGPHAEPSDLATPAR